MKELGLTYAKLNWMKAGFLSSDKNVTVSPNYAEEVVSNPSKGVELDNASRRRIEGIVNGMDSETFNPLKCKFILGTALSRWRRARPPPRGPAG